MIFFYVLLSKKTAFSAIFRAKSLGNRWFSYIPGGLKGLFDFFDSPHHHFRPGTPPANSWNTKQFLSRPTGL
jgi:hypothetical protein